MHNVTRGNNGMTIDTGGWIIIGNIIRDLAELQESFAVFSEVAQSRYPFDAIAANSSCHCCCYAPSASRCCNVFVNSALV